LILEDNPEDAALIKATLKKAGMHFNIKEASSREDFINAIDSFAPEIILSDHQLPQFSSIEALQIARKKLPYVPFILVTGTVCEEFAASIIKEGADDYILKDRMARLPATIEAALNQRKANKEIADYKYALDQAAIVAITDQKGKIIYANENFCRISKYSAKELIGQDHRIINSGNHPNSYIKNLWATIASGNIWKGEFRNRAKDGSLYWVDTTIIPLLNENGKPYQYLSIRVDITERKEADEKLIQSEEKYRAIFLKSPLPKWVYDCETLRFLEVNEAAIQHYGYSREEFLGMTLTDIRPIEDVEALLSDIIKIKDEQGSRQSMWRHRKKNGELITMETTAHYVDYNNRKARMVVANDVTEKQRAERELLQSQVRLKQSQEIAHMGSWEVNFEMNSSKWSDEAYRIYGIEPGDHRLSIDEWMTTIHPDDLTYLKNEIEKSRATLTNIAFYHRIIRKDGVVRYVYSESKYEFNNEGSPIGLYGITLDITESKQAEEQLRQSETRLKEAQAIAHISNWEIDLLQNIHTWSDEFYRIYGINKGDVHPSAELFLSFMHPGDAGFAQKQVQEGFTSFKNSSFNFRFLRKDGAIRHGHTEWKFQFDEKGKPVQFFGIVQDITEHMEAEEAMKSMELEILHQKVQEQKRIARAMILAQEKEKDHLGRELHDNINQLLAGAKLYLSTGGNKSAQVKKIIKYPIELIDKSIEEIRSLCRKMVIPVKDIDLSELVQGLLYDLTQNSTIKSAFTCSISNESLSDDLKLNIYRIIQEQTNNILKHAEAKNVNISLKERDNVISIIIADDGKGFNVKSKRKGIGISNMINRIESYNGKVEIKSREGNGCKIQVTIPV